MKSMINRSKSHEVPLCGDETKLIEVILKLTVLIKILGRTQLAA